MREEAEDNKKELSFDVPFLLATLALMVAGTVMVYSASFFLSKEMYGNGSAIIMKRLFHLVIGCIVMITAMFIDYRKVFTRPVTYLLLIAGLVSLVLCFIPGVGITAGHAKRWVNLIIIKYQASELMKIAMLVYMSYFLSSKSKNIEVFSVGVFPVLFICSIAAGLILIEPDFGTAGILFVWTVMVLFIAGMRIKHLLILGAATLPLGVLFMVFEPYRRARLTAFINPWQDMQGNGYQIIQSMVAFSKGGFLGTGLGEGGQKLFFLPAPHTDFIMAVLGEETGFIGVAVIVVLFGIWVWRGLKIAKATNDLFGFFLAVSSVILVGLQAIINIGVAMSLFPTTGIPLPFFSFGGTTLVSTMLACGIILSVSRGART
ncbi:MAG TPA: putative lipid II flippase FtsW [Desulfomonilia bacterium]